MSKFKDKRALSDRRSATSSPSIDEHVWTCWRFEKHPHIACKMPPPTKFAVLLFPGFQALDVFGPLDVLNMLSRGRPFEFSVVAARLGPVPTRASDSRQSIGQQIVATHTLQDAPEDIEVLLVPGGMGTRNTEATQPEVDFIRERFPRLRFLLTVCTGSALAARAGVLDGKRATTNKASFDWVSCPRASVYSASDDERH